MHDLHLPALFALASSPAAGGGELEVFQLVMGLLGGLALFLFGMEQMADALKAVAGARMRDILARLTANRLMGAAGADRLLRPFGGGAVVGRRRRQLSRGAAPGAPRGP